MLVLGSLAALAPSASAGKPPTSIAVLDSLTGGSTISQGSVVYVDFWASWCVPCRRSFPWMMDLLGKYRDKGLQVVTINLDRDQGAARKFLGDTNASLHVVYDSEGGLAKLYGLEVMPTSFVYARDGTLKLCREGFDPKETESVEKLIRTLIEEKPTE
jgi:cytochrome c biogenesis protein CcmG/thiol:disulfide interchange protein DsbE